MTEGAPSVSLADRFPALKRLQTATDSRRIPFIQQMSATECGAACLAMVLAYFGKHLRLEEIRDITGLGRDGVDALTLLKAARSFGLQARGIKVELDALPFMQRGTILHWEFSHFVVFDRLRKGGVEIVDPAYGRRFVSMAQFGASFTGVALTLKPGSGFERAADASKPVWSYFLYLLRQSGLVGRVLTVSLLMQLLALSIPALMGLLVNSIVPHDDAHLLNVLGIGLAGIVVFQYLSAFTRSHLLLYLRAHMDAQMTLGFVEHLVSLPFSFFQQRSEGDLIMRINSNATIREMLTSNTISGLLDGLMATLYLLVLLAASPPMCALVLGLGVLQCGIFLFSYRRYQELMSRNLQAQARSQSHLVQMLAGIETLKAAAAEERSVQQWSNLFVDELNVTLSRGRLSAAVDSLISAVQLGSPLLVLWFGGLQVLNGNLGLGSMLALTALASGFLGPVSTLIASGLQLQLLRSYVERIDDVLKTPAEQEPSVAGSAPRLSGEVRLENVTFQYGPLISAGVRNVSVRIEPGQMVAIVGRSGAGKSTLAKVMLGLYAPGSGRVLYDGVDAAGIERRTLRRQFGVVTQRSYIFGTSIRLNIATSDSSIALPDIVRAAELACIHDDIAAMPMGYETAVMEGGGSLSGGQRQRLALARALVHQPAILLLDEATSELDTITEARVHRNLAELQCTRVVIAHRLSTIRNADIILVLDDGMLVEQGTHEELLLKRGHYAALVRGQIEADDCAEADRRRGGVPQCQL